KLLNVLCDKVVLPDGRESTREYIKHPGASVVIPYLNDKRVLLIRQFRYPVNRVMIELPAGKIDPDESPENTIKRELEEETGYSSNNIIKLCIIHTCVGYSDELLHLFWAYDLKPCINKPDYDEKIELLPMNINDAMEMIYSGKLTDAKSIIGLFWADKIINNRQFSKRVLK
ncbi:MAG: NUDIX hydrolase, partial [Candidatus Marinimicrobia bacterium]|nr:NUDIX hydrolase [Candidatus Neomarinimicrobiota bacterium]